MLAKQGCPHPEFLHQGKVSQTENLSPQDLEFDVDQERVGLEWDLE